MNAFPWRFPVPLLRDAVPSLSVTGGGLLDYVSRRHDATLLGGNRRSPDAGLPRPRMGGPIARQPRTVREARVGRFPGGPVMGGDPAQAGAVPGRVRRVRPGASGALRRTEDRAAAPRSRPRAQPAEGARRGA